jgi:hypothetical protein
MVPWIVFYHGERELAAVTLQGLFPGEIRETIALLACERGVPEDAIRVALEDRPLRSAAPVSKTKSKTAKNRR